MVTPEAVDRVVSQLKIISQKTADLPKAVQGFLARNPQRQRDNITSPNWRVNWEEKWITNYPDPD